MTALYLAVMPRSVRPDELMADTVFLQTCLKEGKPVTAGSKTVCELGSVIRLNTLYGKRKSIHKMIHKHGRGISTVFLKGFHVTPAGIFINGGILEELLSDHLTVDKAGGRDELYVDLYALFGMSHLFIRLGNVFGIGRMNGRDSPFSEETVKSRDGTGVFSLHKHHPKYDKSRIRIAPAHVRDEFNLIGGMLIRVVMRPAGVITERFHGTVVTPFPTVNILSVGFVLNRGLCDTEFFSVLN